MEADSRVTERGWKPQYCVWELTLACDQRCAYCGSSAGTARARELSETQCLTVVAQLAELGCEIVSLSGGEPTLRSHWDSLALECRRRGMAVNMVTHGVFRRPELRADVVNRALDAGLCNVGVSIDGPLQVHEALRGEGTFGHAVATIEHFARAGLPVVAMTTVGRLNLAHLAATMQIAIEAGASMWRLQLAKPMGRLSSKPNFVLEPPQVVELVDRLVQLKRQRRIVIAVGDSIGYFGREGDKLRADGWRHEDDCWQGCQAGMRAIGIEADGAVKGCLSLQAKRGSTDPFVEGNVAEQTLESIWTRHGAFAFNRDFSVEQLRGACKRCRHRLICRGGAACVASAVRGAVGEDPYCYHRWSTMQAQNTRMGVSRSVAATAAALAIGASGCGGSVIVDSEGLEGAGGAMGDASLDTGSPQSDAATSAETAIDAAQDWGDATQAPDQADEVDCSNINCYIQVDYGPPGFWDAMKQCCCQTACCMCDYGPPPPPMCCH